MSNPEKTIAPPTRYPQITKPPAPEPAPMPQLPKEPVASATEPEALYDHFLEMKQERDAIVAELEKTRSALAETQARLQANALAAQKREKALNREIELIQARYENALRRIPPAVTQSPANAEKPTLPNHIPARRFITPLIILAVCLLLGMFLVIVAGRKKHDVQNVGRTRPEQATPASETAEPAISAPTPARNETAIWQDFNNMRGARMIADNQRLTLIFDDPVFEKLIEPTRAGHSRLQALGRIIKNKSAEYAILIEGHTDNQPLPPDCPYPSPEHLALARARKAALILREAAAPALLSVQAVSLGSRNPPFPNTSPALSAHNNTVVIKITRVAK